MRARLSLRLALADLRHARLATLCQVIGLAALLLPMLILFGVKNGVIADRTADLLSDPEALRITIGRTDSYSAEMVEALSRDPDVRFVAPHPIQLAVISDFARPEAGSEVIANVTLLATGTGDPYLPAGSSPPRPGEIVVSAPLAGALDLAPGDPVDALLRPNDAEPRGGVLSFTVAGTVPAGVWGRVGALLHADDLFLIQDWTHGQIAGSDLNPARESVAPARGDYPSMRLYAASPEGAFRLMERLAAEGIPTGGTPDRAARLVFLKRALDAGFLTVAAVGLIGVTATFSANLWTAVMRNRRSISLLRLGGLDRRSAVLLPVIQAVVIGALGWALALALYAGLSRLLDRLLATTFDVSGDLARLGATEIWVSAAATLAVSVLAAIWAAAAITSITPEEGFIHAA